MKKKDQILLEEAYQQIQINESLVTNILNWIQSITGADPLMLRTLYVKDIVDFLVSLGFAGVVIIPITLLTLAKVYGPDLLEKFLAKIENKLIKTLVNTLKNDEEAQTLVTTLASWKEDQSKEGVLRRKAAAERLKEIIDETNILSKKGDMKERGFETLKSYGKNLGAE